MARRTIITGVSRGFVLCLIFLFCMATKKLAMISDLGNPQLVEGTTDTVLLKKLLSQYPGYFGPLLADPESYRIQIIYSSIDRKPGNKPVFTDHYFQVDPDRYFYPASTVKMPTADRKSTRLNSSHTDISRMPSSA